jgi:hypothetical protein
MKTKIENLKQIIASTIELNFLLNTIHDDWNQNQFNIYVENLITDLPKYINSSSDVNRKLLSLLNDYDENNTYKL